jgi:hypothetical protein
MGKYNAFQCHIRLLPGSLTGIANPVIVFSTFYCINASGVVADLESFPAQVIDFYACFISETIVL